MAARVFPASGPAGQTGRLLLLAAALSGATACARYEPKAFTANDDCRDCPPGIFSGEDGVLTLYGGETGGVFGGGPTPSPQAEPQAMAAPAEPPVLREEYETVIKPDGTVIERRTVIRSDGTAEASESRRQDRLSEGEAALLSKPLPRPSRELD